MSPPKWSSRVLRLLIHNDYLEEIEGDLEEVFQDDLELYTHKIARRNYNWGVIKLIRPGLIKKMRWLYQSEIINSPMRTIKIACRNLLKFKLHTAINLVGLSIGLAIGGLVLRYAMDQLTYDHFHRNKDRIFKIVTASSDGGMETNAWPVGYRLKTDFPEVETMVYSRRARSGMKIYHETHRYDHEIFFASEDFFQMFSFPFQSGDPESALDAPYSIVLTRTLADKYFEGEALGKTVTIQDSIDFTVTGVLEDLPNTSHIQFEALISFSTLPKLEYFSYTDGDGWMNFNVRNYIMLKHGVSTEAFQAKVSNLYRTEVGDRMEELGVDFTVALIPLTDVFLQDQYWNGFGPNGNRAELRTLVVIAVFLLILACVNYINLSTARATHRAKEIGIKKVVGSSRNGIITQFMAESTLLTCLAFLLGLLLILAVLPLFNQLMNRQYEFMAFLEPGYLVAMLLLIVLVSVVSGFYPALVMSGFKPLQALAGKGINSRKSLHLRKSLIIFQFFVSSGLVLATLLVISQLQFMKDQNLGFDKEQVLIVEATNVPRSTMRQVLENQLSAMASVQSVSQSNALPGRPGWQGQWAYPEQFSDEPVDTEYMAIDEQYVQTLGLQLVAGRNFDLSRSSELENGLLINEACVKAMGWTGPDEAIGKEIVSPSSHPAGTVIGVVKDYHGLGLQERIWPKAMDYASDRYSRYFAVRFNPGQTKEMLQDIEEAWDQAYSGYPLQYFFLDEDFERQYQEENRLASMLIIFAIVVILVSIIGLLGLISFITLSKTKEVGIRKVLGANIGNIIFVLSRQFIALILLGNVLAIPLIWYFGNEWLQTFAYHTALNPLIFLLATVATTSIALGAIGLQTFRTAKMNPVSSLRYE